MSQVQLLSRRPETVRPNRVLPLGGVSIRESARRIFQLIAPSQTIFWRSGALVELVERDKFAMLEVLKSDAFRSRVERHGQLFAWRAGENSKPVLKPSKMSRDDASAIMAATEAGEFLPAVSSVLRCPVLLESSASEVKILGRGYHPELGGMLIVAGDVPPRVELSEAVTALKRTVEEFSFQSEGDRSRALAAFITPALRMGGLLEGNVTIDVSAADKSQAGKGHRLEMVCAVYNEKPRLVTLKSGGVGSVDESFAAALITGTGHDGGPEDFPRMHKQSVH